MRKNFLILFFIPAFIISCSSAQHSVKGKNAESPESMEDAVSALGSVAGAMSGQEMTDEKLKELSQQLRHDKEAQSAIQTVTGVYTTPQDQVKYCPVDGKHYSSHLTICPEHNVELKAVEDNP